MAARAIWKGVVRFGDVRVPVKLYSAVQDRSVHFRLLDEKEHAPIRQSMVNPETDEIVPHEASRRAGIATFVMRDKEYLVVILAEAGLLRAETLRFPDEIRSPEDVGLPRLGRVDAVRVRAIEKAMKPLAAATLDADLVADRQSERLLELVRRKIAAGEDVVAAPAAAEPEEEGGAEVIDLMAALERSLGERPARRERGGTSSRGKGRRRGRSATSSATKRSKDELYRRARELRIEGRSSMTKEELAEAIRAAG